MTQGAQTVLLFKDSSDQRFLFTGFPNSLSSVFSVAVIRALVCFDRYVVSQIIASLVIGVEDSLFSFLHVGLVVESSLVTFFGCSQCVYSFPCTIRPLLSI